MRVALALALALFTSHASAQANAEILRANPLREGWSGGIDASLALLRGNVELLDLGGAGRIQYQSLHPVPEPPPAAEGEEAPAPPLPFFFQRVFLAASGRFAERAGTPFLNQAFAHARWTAMWHERVGTDLFAQVQHNEFQRLQLRFVTGGGLRVELVHEPVFMMWGGSGYMFEHDRISVLTGAPDAPESFDHRWTSYLTMRLAVLESQLLVQNTVYYQPRFDDFEDFRFLEELEVMSRIASQFLFGATLTVLYDSQPPTGVVPADLRLMSMLRLDL
jgi:hypothetical protein